MNIDNLTAGIPVTETFLDRLRSKTSHSHKKLESLPISASIVSPDVTRAAYVYYLVLMHDIVKETEEKIFPILDDVIADLDERRKLPLLENDLIFLDHRKHHTIPVFGNKPISVAFALGMMYTVEGSSLGGRFILKNIQNALGYDEQNGAQYFAGYANKTGNYWKSFLNVLMAYEHENNAADEIIAGAEFAFRAIHNHFAEHSGIL